MKKRILVIICVLVFSFFVIQGAYAIFKGQVSGNKTVSTAGWSVSLNQANEDNHLSIISGDSTSVANYTLNIVSNSEVDVVYSITINGLEDGVSVALNNSDNFVPASNGKIVFGEVGTIQYNPNGSTASIPISFKAASNAAYVVDSEVTISVTAKQAIN